MADNDMMVVPGFGQMTRAQVEREKQAMHDDYVKLNPHDAGYSTLKRNISDKMSALKQAYPSRGKRSVRVI